jgi:hypothetical protein
VPLSNSELTGAGIPPAPGAMPAPSTIVAIGGPPVAGTCTTCRQYGHITFVPAGSAAPIIFPHAGHPNDCMNRTLRPKTPAASKSPRSRIISQYERQAEL